MISPSAEQSVQFVPVADGALLIHVASKVSQAASDLVQALDRQLIEAAIDGVLETTPAMVNVLVVFDPVVLDHHRLQMQIESLLPLRTSDAPAPAHHRVDVCYEPEFALDLETVAHRCGMSSEAVVRAHLAGDYRIAMFGFAPGYAYLTGVPGPLQVPRKPTAVRGVAAGSVIIAGPQCLVTTLQMPTGWSILGRSPTEILQAEHDPPVAFGLGDRVSFVRIDRAEFDRAIERR